MKTAYLILICVISLLNSSGLDEYVIPGVETDEVLMSIHVWGQVMRAGTYLVPVDADLIAGISVAGGPTETAELSKVSIVYDSTEVVYDLKDFLNGEGEPIPVLMPGATIYIGEQCKEWWKDTIDFAYKIIIAVNVIWIMVER